MPVLPYFFLIAGFVVLIAGADILVKGASSIARRLNVSDLVIGLTVVAFGTSSPELFVNILASSRGESAIAIGNVIGSNISNIFLILGVSSLIGALAVSRGTVWREIPLSLLAVLVLGVVANDQLIDGTAGSVITRADGFVLLSFFIIFIYYSTSIARRIEGMDEHVPSKLYGMPLSTLMVVGGLAGLGIGGELIVRGAVNLARTFGVSESLIGLTIVAVGTSLPELATSAVASLKKNADIAVGNVVGSNIFNVLFVLGISSVVRPLPFERRNNPDLGVVVLASLLLFAFMFSGRRRSLDRWEGAVFVALYAVYIVFLILRG
jgi:cation:H+ antiporter